MSVPMSRAILIRKLLLVSTLAFIGAGAGVAFAQQGPGGFINPQRDCQTIVNCRFTKGGSYRGCVSSYSCRVCRFVDARCGAGAAGNVCRKLRCDWG